MSEASGGEVESCREAGSERGLKNYFEDLYDLSIEEKVAITISSF